MIEKVSGKNHATAVERGAGRDHQVEEELDSRQIVREAMRSRAFREAKMSLTQGRRRRHDAGPATFAERSKLRRGVGMPDPAGTGGPGSTEQNEPEVSIRVDTEALLESINFNEGSIEELVSEGLEGKLKKAEANLVAFELGKLINCSAYYSGMSVEKQTVNREIGLKLAGCFAKAFIDDPAEAEAFIDEISDFAKRDIMLEKGYYFWEGRAYEIYKPVPVSVFYEQCTNRWSKETAEAFKANEKKVSNRISAAIATLDDDAAAKKWKQIMAEYSLITAPVPVKEGGIKNGVQWIHNTQGRLYA